MPDLVGNPEDRFSHDVAHTLDYMSLVMRKPALCIYKNKEADQLHSNCEADQRLCFCYKVSTIPLLP